MRGRATRALDLEPLAFVAGSSARQGVDSGTVFGRFDCSLRHLIGETSFAQHVCRARQRGWRGPCVVALPTPVSPHTTRISPHVVSVLLFVNLMAQACFLQPAAAFNRHAFRQRPHTSTLSRTCMHGPSGAIRWKGAYRRVRLGYLPTLGATCTHVALVCRGFGGTRTN